MPNGNSRRRLEVLLAFGLQRQHRKLKARGLQSGRPTPVRLGTADVAARNAEGGAPSGAAVAYPFGLSSSRNGG